MINSHKFSSWQWALVRYSLEAGGIYYPSQICHVLGGKLFASCYICEVLILTAFLLSELKG